MFKLIFCFSFFFVSFYLFFLLLFLFAKTLYKKSLFRYNFRFNSIKFCTETFLFLNTLDINMKPFRKLL